MTRIFNDPALFMEEMLEGFVNAHADAVVAVPGGVIRADLPPPGKVAVVIGGGSGHYPAFAGVVGTGFADGAVVGNVFTSPSAEDAYGVSKAASVGGGVVLSSGNYAGDVLHFTAAAERLRQEGIPTEVVFVTDDVASAPASEASRRRGIAGDFVIFKVMGAAAEEGSDLETVVRVGLKANDRTRTLGVAFSGCTLPGDTEPLFIVPEGRMGVGLGIHGEAGISEGQMPSADTLASILVNGALDELDLEAGDHIGVILNGLGATKYEELFLLWRTVSCLLRDRGLVVVEPEVGELVTSLNMAGCSLTVVALDDELERLWRAPAYTPAFKKGRGQPGMPSERRVIASERAVTESRIAASKAALACACRSLVALSAMRGALVDAQHELGRIDAVAGDGDHGRGMVKGIEAALAAAEAEAASDAGVGSVLQAAGRAWESKAGGTSGALWGAALIAVGDNLGDQRDAYEAHDLLEAMRAGFEAIRRVGNANLGDKTMLDAFGPFLKAFESELAQGVNTGAAWASACSGAVSAAQETAGMLPKVGRARPLAERSIGTPDAGATSLALCLTAATDAFNGN